MMTAPNASASRTASVSTPADRTASVSTPADRTASASTPTSASASAPTSAHTATPVSGDAPAPGAPARARQGPDDLLLLGVRHHGPGSARAVRAALDAYQPQAVLIEGPPETDALTALAADPAMRPPVALLAHVTDDPGRAAFWPFAEFSPEWVAIQWAARAGAAVRFIDLPAAHTLARPAPEPDADGTSAPPPPAEPESATSATSATPDASQAPKGESGDRAADAARLRVDPIAVLAQSAGYDDPERWWEDAVEHQEGGGDAFAPFEAVAEAMGAIRETYGEEDARDLLREAHMRLRVREARRAYERTAVVCGAWHVPALAAPAAAAADRQLLKGLPKVKVETTWVPWTHRRLARAGGYGAGIDSPGWYQHLFTAPDRPVTRWMTKVAGLLREEDLPVSSAHVIEAVRLADTLAVMRGRPLAGLGETTDAIRAVMCDGSDVPLALIRDRLVVGDVLGEVPPDAPAVPLARDLAREQRRLRLKPDALEKELELDLRKEMDAARSQLLHRLVLLGIDWGVPAAGRNGKGTFRETWRLRWEPEAAIRIAEAGIWGTTVRAAASARAQEAAVSGTTLADVTTVAELCLLAGLSDALPMVMRILADRAALDADVAHLAAALPALVRAVRYGDVRGTDSAALTRVAEGLALRVCIGFPPACVNLDADGAAALRAHMDETHRAIALLPDPPAPATTGEAGPASGEPVAETAEPVPATGKPAPALAAGEPAPANGEPALAAGEPALASAEPALAAGEPAAASAEPVPAAGEPALASAEPALAAGEPAPANGEPASPGAEPAPVGPAGAIPAPAAGGAARDLRDRWAVMLRSLAERDGAIPGLLRGAAARLLLDEGRLDAEEAARLMGLALSPGTGPAEAAGWIEGFLAGGGMLLVHDERLLGLVDGWLAGVRGEAFTDVLPLLRRTFAEFEPGARRSVGELVRRGPATVRRPAATEEAALPGFGPGLDRPRADAAARTVRLLLGRTTPTDLLASTAPTTDGLEAPTPADPADPARPVDPINETRPTHPREPADD